MRYKTLKERFKKWTAEFIWDLLRSSGATNFPGSLDSYSTKSSGDTISEAHINDPQDAIEAIEAKAGTGASTPIEARVLCGNGTGTSAWEQVNLADAVTGTLPVGSLPANSAFYDTGSYTGNSSGTRDIAVDFTPTWVTIVGQTANPYTYYITPNMNKYHWASSNGAFSTGGTLGANKFTVGADQSSANYNTETYDWIAFK